MEAALQGAQEIGFTVFSISVSLIAVFIPHPADGRHRRAPVPRVRHYAFERHPGLDGDLADDHADDVLARADGGEGDASTAALYTGASAVFNARARAATGAASTWVLDHPALMLVIVFLLTLGLNVFLIAEDSQRIFPAAGYRGDAWAGCRGRRTLRFYAMQRRACSSRSTSSRPTPAVENVMGFTGRTGRPPTAASCFVALKPLDRAHGSAEADHRPAAPEAGARARRRHLPAGRAGHPHRRPAIQRRNTSTRCRPNTAKICNSTARCCCSRCSTRRASRT